MWKPGNELDILVVENAGYSNLTHRRSLFFIDKRYFVIVDEAIGKGTGDIDLHFQLAPGDAIFDYQVLSVQSDFKEGWNVHVQTEKQNGLKLEEEEGQISFIYTKKEPRPAFRYSIKKESENSGIRFITIVVPFEHEKPNLKVNVVGDSQPGSSNLQLEVQENGKNTYFGYSL